jgi:hypothetical protein
VKRVKVPVNEKPEEHIGSHGSLYQVLLAADTRPPDLLQPERHKLVRNGMDDALVIEISA